VNASDISERARYPLVLASSVIHRRQCDQDFSKKTCINGDSENIFEICDT
jgi:hypothetical protein